MLALHIAYSNNQNDVAKALINGGTDMNYELEDGSTLIHFAALSGDEYALKQFIDHGADLNIATTRNSQETPLLWLARGGHTHLVDMMIEGGAILDLVGENSHSVMHEVALSGNVNFAEKLIELGMDVNEKDLHGHTVLYRACDSHQTGLAEFLVSKGADKSIKSDGKRATDLEACLTI